MMNLNVWKKTCLAILICVGTAIALHAQTFTILTNFDGTNGSSPSSLVQGTDGNFHGTSAGGANGVGTIFKVSRIGVLSGLSFCAQIVCAVGFAPEGGLVQTIGGNFYGTTSRGGAFGFSGLGTVFRITQKGRASAPYSFCARLSCVDGADPSGPLIEALDQNLYGVTRTGGAKKSGTVFSINPGGILATLYSFCLQLDCADGAGPEAGLVQGPEGAFYGTTPKGGVPVAAGTIFKITSAGVLTTLYTFSGPDGDSPSGSLIVGSDGNLYGATAAGGIDNSGTIFKITPNGQLTTLYRFCIQAKCADGILPSAPLVQASDGNLYGTTGFGGTNGFGTIFRMTPQGALTTLHSFDSLEGAIPGPLLQATDGNFYGTTVIGGTSNNGTFYSLSVGLDPFVALMRAFGKVGSTIGILGQGFTGTTDVSLNGTGATFTVVSDTYLTAKVLSGATTGFVTVTTPSGTLTSNKIFRGKP